MSSKDDVIKHEKFEEIFAKYADAIGLYKEQSYPEWDEITKKL
jgi:DNA gyrase/topoisomerase IV subunit A